MKFAASVLASLALVTLSPAFAGGDHQPKFGGKVSETTTFELELVAKDKDLVLHITDHKGKKIDTKDASATATVMTGKLKETVKLSARADGTLQATANATFTAETKIVLSVSAAGKTEQTRFVPLQNEKDGHKEHKH